MLQQQQALLERLIESQEALKDKHSVFEAKLADIEQKCLSSCTPPPSQSSDDTSQKRKHTVTRELSVSVYNCIALYIWFIQHKNSVRMLLLFLLGHNDYMYTSPSLLMFSQNKVMKVHSSLDDGFNPEER